MSQAERTLVATGIGRLATTLHRGADDRLPLLLSHGIYMDSSLWDGLVPAFTGRTVVTVDGPGHGRSDDPPSSWGLDQHVAALTVVMDHHGLHRAVLVGHSWGGMVSLRLCLAHPDRVAGLGLVNTPLTRTAGLARAGFRAQQALLLATGPTRFYSRQAAGSLYDTATLRRRPALAADMADRLRARRGSTLSRTLSAVILQPVDMLGELGQVTIPTSVVAGATDYVLPPATRRAITQALPQAVVTLVAGGHTSPQEDPGSTTAALRELLTRADRQDLDLTRR